MPCAVYLITDVAFFVDLEISRTLTAPVTPSQMPGVFPFSHRYFQSRSSSRIPMTLGRAMDIKIKMISYDLSFQKNRAEISEGEEKEEY